MSDFTQIKQLETDRPRILIIDDDALMRLALAKILLSAGYDVEQAGDGDEGLRLQRSQSFDLIITDLIMPDKEGIQIIRELRKEDSAIRIIAVDRKSVV